MKQNTGPVRLLKKILAIASMVVGGVMLFAMTAASSWHDIVSSIALGFAFIFPAAWWFLKEQQDRTAAERYEETAQQHSYFSELLSESDPEIVTAMGAPAAPKPVKRHWGLVSLMTLIAVIVAVAVAPSSDAEAEASDITTPSTTPATSSVARVADTVSASPTEPTPAPTEAPQADIPPAVTPEMAPAQANTQPQGFVAPPPVAEPAPAPAPAPAAAYYANCSEARDAGVTPVYAGQPGYRSGLDRDGDGIACE